MSSQCSAPDRCGSCTWSEQPYERQLKTKQSEIEATLQATNITLPTFNVTPSPQTTNYRNRMDFVIDFEGRVGMREKGKWWKVIDDHTCFLSEEKIEELFHLVRQWVQEGTLSYFDRKRHHGFLRYAVIRTTTTGESMIIIVTSDPEDEAQKQTALTALKKLGELTNVTSLIWSINHTISDVSFGETLITIQGSDSITEMINGYTYKISPHAFFQTNSHAAALLMNTVTNMAGNVSNKKVLDLYCGSGFFSMPLAKNALSLCGVELDHQAIIDAKENAHNNTVNATFFDLKAEEFEWNKQEYDLVVVDPPRSGLHPDALKQLLQNQPEEIIYVSCNYKKFAEEMLQLKDQYEIKEMQAIDMFPHTPHVELVSLLVTRGKSTQTTETPSTE